MQQVSCSLEFTNSTFQYGNLEVVGSDLTWEWRYLLDRLGLHADWFSIIIVVLLAVTKIIRNLQDPNSFIVSGVLGLSTFDPVIPRVRDPFSFPLL